MCLSEEESKSNVDIECEDNNKENLSLLTSIGGKVINK